MGVPEMQPGQADLARNLERLRERLGRAAERAGRNPQEITVVAVSKTVEVARIKAALAAGVVHIGENRVQEALPKVEALAQQGLRPTWHMVGHLQTNKVKTALRIFDIIHSVDSYRLAETIARLATRKVPVFVQVNVAREATKGGFGPEEVEDAVARIRDLPNLEVLGLMTIAPLVADPEEVRPVFRRLRELNERLGLSYLSMGMTDDFEVAVEEGATHLRIGRAIFGERG
jgi:hypothetical protein